MPKRKGPDAEPLPSRVDSKKRPVPATMLASADGGEYVDIENPDGYDDDLPLEIAERLYGLYD